MSRILPVEDNEINRDRLSRLLARNGCEVVCAMDGAEGVAMEGDEQKARDAGCEDYDVKPIELPRLLFKIDALLAPG